MFKNKLLRLDLQWFADGEGEGGSGEGSNPPAISLDAIQSFVTTDEAGKNWLKSLTDNRVTDAINTYKADTLPRKVEEEISKRFPAETEDQKKLRTLQEEIESIRSEKTRETNKNKALSIASEKTLPVNLLDYFIANDEETTIKNLGVLENEFTAAVKVAVDAEVQKRFGEAGRNPNPSNPGGGGAGDSFGKQVAATRIQTTNLEESRQSYFK